MKFTSFKLVATAVLFAALTACGGGGGDPLPTTPSVPTNPATNEFAPLTRYSGPTGTFQRLNLTMKTDGIVDFSLIGVKTRIFDTSMRLIEESSYSPDTTYLVNLPAGSYVVEYEFWSANSRDAVAYSPALLNFGSLPQLKNAVYSSSENTTTFYRASFATESTVNFSGQGVYIAVLRSDMSLVYNIGSSFEPKILPAGDYVFHLKFLSSNSRSVSITSTGLPS
jgi:hypothetical protein